MAVWNRALSPDEIAALSGGTEHVRQRELAILGDESPSHAVLPRPRPQPQGRRLHPLLGRANGTFRLFYLILRRNMHSKWDGGHGGLEIWQASTKDLKTWTHHPVTIPITEQWEAWNGTGAVAFHNGQYNWFYPTPHYDGEHSGVQRAVSKDGVTFTKTKPHPFLPGGDVEIFQTERRTVPPDQERSDSSRRKPSRCATRRWSPGCAGRSGSARRQRADHRASRRCSSSTGSSSARTRPRRWMPGSDTHQRTPAASRRWPEENAGARRSRPNGAGCDGTQGTLYRNGAVYASYTIANPLEFPSGSSLLIGLATHARGPGNSLFPRPILDARVYDSRPCGRAARRTETGRRAAAASRWRGTISTDGSLRDRTGNFPDGLLFGGARVENGELCSTAEVTSKCPARSTRRSG